MICLYEYNIDMQTYTQSGKIVADCNGIEFINVGTSNVLINSTLPLAPQGSWSVDGNSLETDRTPYTITFDNTGINNCVVNRKLYLKMEII